MDLDTIARKIGERMAGSGFSHSAKLDFKGEGTILIDGESVSTGEGEADCTVIMSKQVFEDIVSGDTSPTAAFMTGKMKVEGDMGAAMALAQAL